MIRVTANVIDGRQVARSIERAKFNKVRPKARLVGEEMARLANAKIADRFDARPFERRRHPGSRRAAGAVSYALTGEDFPINIQFKAVGGADVKKRVMVLHYGRGPSRISPSGTWPLTGQRFSINRFTRPQATGNAPRRLAFPVPEGGRYRFAPVATSRATSKGAGFLDEAMREAVAKILR